MTVGAGHSAARIDPGPGEPRRPGKKWRLALLGLVATFVVLSCYDLISMSGHYGSSGAATAAGTASASSRATPADTRHGALSPSAAPTRPAPIKAAAPVPHPLGLTSVAAFGPEGLSDGDNPAIVSRILDVSTDQPWYSQWYATPEFGNLRSGTGLLLDMGETVTVKSAQLVLGAAPGADVQVRVGNDAYLADLPSVASAGDVGGTVRLTATTPARGRYVLIWFTRLPLNSRGEYQIDVYGVTIDGTGGA